MYDDTILVDKDFYNKLKEHYNHFQWISVKDRLPEPSEKVLTYGVKTVTHWMPLPEPPKEKPE